MPFRKLDLQFVDTDIANIIDPLLVFNYSATGNNTSDSGVIIERGDLNNVGIIWDESTDTFALINTSEDGSTTGDVTISSYANLRADTITATLSGNVTGNITGNVTGDLTGNVTSTGTSSFSSIDINGGAIDGTPIGASSASTGAFSSLTTSGNATIGGNLTVNGTTKTVNSTVVQVADPIMTVGGTSSPSTDDNKDRGIAFRWHNGTSAKIGFFGFDDSTGKFTFVPDANLSNEVVSGTAGDVEFGSLTASGLSYPTSDGASNHVIKTDGSGNLSFVSVSTLQAASIANVVEDTTPQLGGDLDVNGQTITSASNGDIEITPNGTGQVGIGGAPQGSTKAHIRGDLRVGSYFETNDRDHVILSTDASTSNIRGNNENFNIYNDQGNINFYANTTAGTDVLRATINNNGLTLTDTDEGSAAAPSINLYRNSASPAAADYIGEIDFQGESSTGITRSYAQIKGKIADPTNTTEDGTLEFWIRNNGSNNITARMNENGILLTDGMTLKYEGATNDSNETTLTVADPTADRTITLPDATGTVALLEGNQTFTNNIDIDGTLNVDGNTTLNGTLTLPDADITFQDNNGTFPTSGKGFYWDLNNDEARIYAIQSASDHIDLVFKVSDNTNNQDDRWVFWLDGYQGQSSDAFPLTMTADNFYVFSDPSSTDGKPNLGGTSPKLHIPSGKTSSSTTTHRGRLGLHGDNTSDLYVRFENTSGNNAYVFQDQSDSNNFKLESHNDICFNTSGANERMVINSSGRVGIGTDPYSDANFHIKNGDVGLEFSLDGAVTDEARLLAYDRVANTRRGLVLDGSAIDNRVDGTTRLEVTSSGITVTGSISATGDVTAYASSDERLKENVVEIDDALEKVKQIRGVEYDWTDEYLKEYAHVPKRDVGVIAQEVEKVLPEIVAERDNGIKAVRYEKLTALLIEAVKELSARVDELEKKQ